MRTESLLTAESRLFAEVFTPKDKIAPWDLRIIVPPDYAKDLRLMDILPFSLIASLADTYDSFYKEPHPNLALFMGCIPVPQKLFKGNRFILRKYQARTLLGDFPTFASLQELAKNMDKPYRDETELVKKTVVLPIASICVALTAPFFTFVEFKDFINSLETKAERQMVLDFAAYYKKNVRVDDNNKNLYEQKLTYTFYAFCPYM